MLLKWRLVPRAGIEPATLRFQDDDTKEIEAIPMSCWDSRCNVCPSISTVRDPLPHNSHAPGATSFRQQCPQVRTGNFQTGPVGKGRFCCKSGLRCVANRRRDRRHGQRPLWLRSDHQPPAQTSLRLFDICPASRAAPRSRPTFLTCQSGRWRHGRAYYCFESRDMSERHCKLDWL